MAGAEADQYTLIKDDKRYTLGNDDKFNNDAVNIFMKAIEANGILVGSPFVLGGSQLCAIVQKHAAASAAAALPAVAESVAESAASGAGLDDAGLYGGKSRARKGYKKYMKKTRKRN